VYMFNQIWYDKTVDVGKKYKLTFNCPFIILH